MKITKKFITEVVKRVVQERKFDATKFPFPKPASGERAKKVATGGKKDGEIEDDVVIVKDNAAIPATQLKPSQQEIKLGQALGMAISMMGKLPGPFKNGPGGDLGAVISKDGYIMDGHHRWAASVLAAGPGVQLGGKVVDMRGEDLVKVLALVGDAFHPGMRKDPSPHNIMTATPEDVNNFINQFVANGIGEFVDAETAKRVLEDTFGSVDKAKLVLADRLDAVKQSPPPWAESRDKMPVLEPDAGEVDKVAADLNAGEVDIFAPYQGE
jgi:hypothetical protein